MMREEAARSDARALRTEVAAPGVSSVGAAFAALALAPDTSAALATEHEVAEPEVAGPKVSELWDSELLAVGSWVVLEPWAAEELEISELEEPGAEAPESGEPEAEEPGAEVPWAEEPESEEPGAEVPEAGVGASTAFAASSLAAFGQWVRPSEAAVGEEPASLAAAGEPASLVAATEQQVAGVSDVSAFSAVSAGQAAAAAFEERASRATAVCVSSAAVAAVGQPFAHHSQTEVTEPEATIVAAASEAAELDASVCVHAAAEA